MSILGLAKVIVATAHIPTSNPLFRMRLNSFVSFAVDQLMTVS